MTAQDRSEISVVDRGALLGIPFSLYPDSTPILRGNLVPPSVERMLLRPRTLTGFMVGMFLVDSLVARGGTPPHLILPCVPGARQDRLNETGDFLFTLKSVARELNLRRFPTVTMIDPHSDVAPALIENARVIRAVDCMRIPPGKYAAVIAPDAGAAKRAQAVAQHLRVPLIQAWKTRDVATGEISGFGMGKELLPLGSLVLVVDDLCDGGGTFIGLAGLIAREGFKAHLWTTHGLYTKGTKPLLEHYGHIYCTDSVLGPREGVIEIKICESILMQGVLP